MNALLLFDIDGTMLATGGLGARGMEEAGKELFGPAFTAAGLDYAGRLDPLLVRELFVNNGVELSARNERAFRSMYARRLAVLFGESTGHRPLPGVHNLLDRLSSTAGDAAMGLLTGNFAETGSMKLRACGIDPSRFSVAAWGDDSPHNPPAREHLPPVAMKRYEERFGRACPPERVTLIGDTPHDVSCGKVHGCRVLAVGTGRFSVPELEQAGADWAVADLSDTGRISAWLTNGVGVG